MKHPIQTILLSCLISLLSCSQGNEQKENEPTGQSKTENLTEGKWYYEGAPESYTEITKDTWTDYMGEMGWIIKHKIHWQDDRTAELEVIESNMPENVDLMPVGYKFKITIQEIREDLLQYNFVSPMGTPMCVYLLKDVKSSAKPSTQC